MSQHSLFSQFLSTTQDLSQNLDSCAVVALIFKNSPSPEVLFIRRAQNPDDRWSGQIAFPGGRMELSETHLRTAFRETQEEIGLDLSKATHWGQLNDIQGRKANGLLPFYVRPLLFHIDEKEVQKTDLQLDPAEVDEAFWIPLSELLDRQNHISYQPVHPEILKPQNFPGIKLQTGDVLWGLSYFMLTDLLNKTELLPEFWQTLA